MLTRISNITSFEQGVHDDLQQGLVAHTNLVFHYQGEYYSSRYSGRHMTVLDVQVEEERFLERRHKRRA